VTGGGDGGGFVDVGMNVAPGLPEVPPHALAAIAETAAEPFSIFRRDMHLQTALRLRPAKAITALRPTVLKSKSYQD